MPFKFVSTTMDTKNIYGFSLQCNHSKIEKKLFNKKNCCFDSSYFQHVFGNLPVYKWIILDWLHDYSFEKLFIFWSNFFVWFAENNLARLNSRIQFILVVKLSRKIRSKLLFYFWESRFNSKVLDFLVLPKNNHFMCFEERKIEI